MTASEPIDGLTGMCKKAAFLEKVDRKVGWMRLGMLPGGTMFVFDINGLHEFNNRYSWAVGDEVIKVVADRPARSSRARRTSGAASWATSSRSSSSD